MYFEQKRLDNSGRNETIFWMIVGPFLVVLIFLYGFSLILLSPVCIVYSILSLLLFIRTHNMGYLIKSMMFFFILVFVILLFFIGPGILTFFIGGMGLVFMIWLFVLIGIRDYKWRTSEVLELAALPVEEIRNGYTMRPMPAGKADYQWNDLIRFSRFIRRNLISVTYHEDEKVIFSLNRSRLKLISFSSDYIQDSWVSFDKSGQIVVHISKEDYKMYKDSYAFDQLCNSLGSLYSDFLTLFIEKKESEIIKKIDIIRV